MRSPFTFRGKAVLLLIPTVVIISLAYTLESTYTKNRILKDEILKKGETIALVAARNAELPILSGNSGLLTKAAVSLKGIQDVAFVDFYDKRFKALIHAGLPSGDKPSIAIKRDGPTFSETRGFFEFYAPVFTIRSGQDIDIFQETFSASPAKEHVGWVRIGFSKDIINKASKDIVTRGVLLALVFTLFGVSLVYAFITMALKPLRLLYNAVKGIREGEYPEIETIPSPDEIGRLSVEFNRMSRAIKEREQKILESEKRMSSLFERVEHAIFRLNKDGDIIEYNKKYDEICGGINKYRDLFPEKQEGRRIQQAIMGKLKHTEETIMGADGNEHVVIMSLYPECDGNGVVRGFDGYFFDISEKKRLEEALIQTQKLESVGLLAGGIAHDFNNILTGILGYATLAKAMAREGDKLYRYTDIIEKSVKRASSLTNQLLGFARKGKYHVVQVNMNSIVRELVTFMKETFDRSITIVHDAADDLPAVDGESNQLYQALLNLCINARDAMPEGGKLHIKTELRLLGEEKVVDYFQVPAGEYVLVSVTDTGTGMTPEIKKRIFEPFYTTKAVGKGTGLGLAMVYGIIKNHNGHITVYSEPGLGTTFHIYLPTAESAAGTGREEEKRMVAPATNRRTNWTVLLIDDEEVVRMLGKEILEAAGCRVFLAAQGAEGIRIFHEQKDRIDLVVLDMIMPEKSGKQVFKELRTIKPDVRIILCSGYGEAQFFHELLEAGASGFLQKPFLGSEIINKIEQVMAEKPA